MSKPTTRYLKIVYFVGIFYGFFTFSFNSSTKIFELSKKLQIYNKTVAFGILLITVMISFTTKTTIPSDNMVIQISTPLNYFLGAGIVLNAYIFFQRNEHEIVKLMNYGLMINNNRKNFEFKLKLFMKTFSIDLLFIFFFFALAYRGLFVHRFEKNIFINMVFLQFIKNINRFMTHLYICGIEYNEHLMSNIENNLTEALRKFERFLLENQNHSKYQLVTKCCQLSDELDSFAIQGRKILNLTNRVHGLFSEHILMMVLFNMTDVLVLVSLTFY